MSLGSNPYNIGDVVYAVSDGSKGTIVAVGKDTTTIQWSDIRFPVVYPDNDEIIRKPFPWEINPPG